MHLIRRRTISDSTAFSLDFPYDPEDKRPLPEIIAANYGFALAYHELEGKRYYAVQDWIAGVA